MRTLIILAAILILIFVLQTLWKSSPGAGKKLANRLILGAVAVLFVFLLVTGRLPWLFALGAAAIPFLKRLVPLIRYVPMLKGYYNRYQQTSKQSGKTGQYSSVQTQYFKMRIYLDSGEMDGQILLGKRQGSQLHQLDLPTLLDLYREISADGESLALLRAYLDRTHPDWKNQSRYNGDNTSTPNPKGNMSTEEARLVLGVTAEASREEIISAHRKLMQKLHPDHGGSTYLAAKINIAKDRLLMNKG